MTPDTPDQRGQPTEPAEVTLARAVLEKHYGEPVYPVSGVCEALYTWMDCIVGLHRSPDGRAWEIHDRQGQSYAQVLDGIKLDTRKSALLWRLLYAKEPLRTRECPEHHGRWSGLEFPGHRECRHGCQLTGWLPEPRVGSE